MRSWILAVFVGWCAVAGAAEPPIRVLLITGSHGFDPRLYAVLEGHKDIVWDKQTQLPDPCRAYEPQFAEDYDVVVLYDFEQQIDDTQKQAFLDAFGEGRGLFVWHHALCSHVAWPAYREMIGGQYFFAPEGDKPASSYIHDVSMTYEPAASGHPILEGLAAYTAVEEPYKDVWQAEGSTPLLTSPNPESDRVVAWAKTYKDSRIVCAVPGHGGDIFVMPEFRQFMAQSIRWLAHRDVAAPKE